MATSIRSPYPDVEIPDVPLAQFVYAEAASRGDRTAIVCGSTGRSYTYAMLHHLVGRCAAGLVERGLQPARGRRHLRAEPARVPDRVPRRRAGRAPPTPRPTRSTTRTSWRFQLRNAHARFLITIPHSSTRAAGRRGGRGRGGLRVRRGGGRDPVRVAARRPSAPTPQPEIDSANDLVSLPYSSGTTGLPKGVMLTHRNLVANMMQFADCRDVDPEDRVIGVPAVLPHLRADGRVMNVCLRRGATIVTMPRFDLEQFLRLIQEHRITFAYVVPPIVLALAKHPLVDDYDLSSLRASCRAPRRSARPPSGLRRAPRTARSSRATA